jgi:hypothetical protein
MDHSTEVSLHRGGKRFELLHRERAICRGLLQRGTATLQVGSVTRWSVHS